MANALTGTVPLMLVNANDEIQVDGWDYPTTYADVARLRPETLWNRFVSGKAYPDAKTAFLVARAIPSVTNLVIVDPVAIGEPQLPEGQIAVSELQLNSVLNALNQGDKLAAQNLLEEILQIPRN